MPAMTEASKHNDGFDAAERGGGGGGGGGGPAPPRGCCARLRHKVGEGTLILIGVVVGVAVGLVYRSSLDGAKPDPTAMLYIKLPGTLWLNLLKLMIIPLIFSNILTGVARMRQMPSGGPMGRETLCFELTTSVIAAVSGLLWAWLAVAPFTQSVMPENNTTALAPAASPSGEDESNLNIGTQLWGVIMQLAPNNIVQSMATNGLVGVIIFSAWMGMVIDVNEDEKVCHILGVTQELNDCILKMVVVVIEWTPVGIFGLVAPLVIDTDLGKAATNIAALILPHLAAQIVHGLFVYPMIFFLALGKNPFPYLKRCAPAWTTAFLTDSSAASLPLTIKCAIERNDVPEPLAKFVLSLGATVNMDGTCLGINIYLVWLACCGGQNPGFGEFVTIMLVAILGSMGTAPIPGGGSLVLVTLATAVNISLDEEETAAMLAVILAIDPVLDRFETAVNVMGDCIAVGVIHGRHLDSWENDLAANAHAVAREKQVAAQENARRPSRVESVHAAFGTGNTPYDSLLN